MWGEFSQNSHHAATAVEEADCLVCHDQTTHMDGIVDLKNADTGALISETASGRFQKANLIETDINNLNTFCQSCHDADGATQEGSPSDPFGDVSAGPPEMSLHSSVDFPADRVEPEFTVGCIQCHEGHGSTNLKLIDDTSVLIDNSVGLAAPGTTSGPVVFTTTTGTDSYDEFDIENTEDADDICATCHINTMTNHTGGDHTASIQGTEERGNDCTSCHPHGSSITTFKGFMPPAGGAATCDTCHATGGTGVGGANNLRPIFGLDGDFVLGSHHVSGTPTDNDCSVCHMEPGSLHQDNKVDLRDPDTGSPISVTFDGSGGVAPLTRDASTNVLESKVLAVQNEFCFKCHDGDGATASYNSVDGSLKDATHPFSSDSLVPNTFDQLDPANEQHHAVRAPAANDHATSTAANGNFTTMEAPWNQSGNHDQITCFDCHMRDDTNGGQINSHGGDFQRMLLDDINVDGLAVATDKASASAANTQATVDNFCTRCHQFAVYLDNRNPDDVGSAFAWHGKGQAGHGSNNDASCFGCHGGVGDMGNTHYNGAAPGNIHGTSFTWPGTTNYTETQNQPTEYFMVGGYITEYWADTAGNQMYCGGGTCNHAGGRSESRY